MDEHKKLTFKRDASDGQEQQKLPPITEPVKGVPPAPDSSHGTASPAPAPSPSPPSPSPSPPPPPPPTPNVTQAVPSRQEMLGELKAASAWQRLGAWILEIILYVVTLYVGWLIWALMIGGTGQTPAKRLMGLRVIRADTVAPAGLGRMFWIRWLIAGIVASFAITLTLGILLFMPFWDKRNQNVWDKVSNTYVVNDPNDYWNTRPDLR